MIALHHTHCYCNYRPNYNTKSNNTRGAFQHRADQHRALRSAMQQQAAICINKHTTITIIFNTSRSPSSSSHFLVAKEYNVDDDVECGLAEDHERQEAETYEAAEEFGA
jgi:hypothetical protein